MKPFIIMFLAAYGLGSINFAILLFKVLGKEDPRTGFSGNPGVTNVYRLAGFFWALVVLVLDVARAMGVAIISVSLLKLELVPWVGMGLILGNRFPCFHGFRGGKGVANYLGFTLILAPLAGAVSALAWATGYALFRMPFIGSFGMVFTLAAGTLQVCDFHPFAAGGILVTVALIVAGHKSNLAGWINKKKNGG
jgi:acyl phosphate:glycerol-3-phosphate acyltransferase